MTATINVRHTVTNYDDWKLGFDGHESNRRLHGATGHRLSHDGETVCLAIDFPDRTSAAGFAADPALREAMSKAGVVGTPQIDIMDSVESVAY